MEEAPPPKRSARAARNLTGLELCAITVLHPPGLGKMVCSLTGFGESVMHAQTSLRLNRDSLVQIGVGRAMIIFGTVGDVTVNNVTGGLGDHEIVVTSAFILRAATA